ncbi:MAG: hypothetical protein V4615_12480 [Bacteroidota bacterium]
MNSKQEDRYGMFLKVDFYLVAQALLLAFNPAIATTRTVLNSLINAIAQADSTATRNITGFTVAKNEHREAQLALFKKVRAGLMAYFTADPDPKKKLVIKFTDSAIDDFRDPEIYIKTDQLLDLALPVKALLVPSGVTEAEVDSLKTLNDAWPAMEPLGRMEEAVNKASRKDVSLLIEQTDTLLDKTLDSYMKVVQYNNANLYNQYQTARMIDDSGGGSDSSGYDVTNITIVAGASYLLPVGAATIPSDLDVYFRVVTSGAIIKVCTTNLPAMPCVSGYDMVAGLTFKGLFSNMGLDMNVSNVQLTNSGATDVLMRVGTKDE